MQLDRLGGREWSCRGFNLVAIAAMVGLVACLLMSPLQ